MRHCFLTKKFVLGLGSLCLLLRHRAAHSRHGCGVPVCRLVQVRSGQAGVQADPKRTIHRNKQQHAITFNRHIVQRTLHIICNHINNKNQVCKPAAVCLCLRGRSLVASCCSWCGPAVASCCSWCCSCCYRCVAAVCAQACKQTPK